MKSLMLFLLIVSLIVPTSLAGHISISLTTEEVVISENFAITKIKIQNLGDETAFNVGLSLVSEEFESDFIPVGSLNPNILNEFNISVSPAKEIIAGSYYAGILVQYEDANGYGFSSVTPNRIMYKTRSASKIFGSIESLSLFDKGKLKLRIRNNDEKEHDIRIRLYTPNEIVTNEEEKHISIKPKEEKEISFSISNFGGLIGSTYTVFASLDYEDGLHYSSVARGIVSIEKEEYSFFFIAAALILILIFAIVNLRHKFKMRTG